MQIQITIVDMKLLRTIFRRMKKNKGLLITWEIIKAIYAIIGMIIILPFAVITAMTSILYENAKTYIQTKIRR